MESPKDDICAAFSGYVPLSTRLVELLQDRSGWHKEKDGLNMIWGPAREIQVRTVKESPGPKIVLVVFLGGVTQGEITTFRKLSELEGGNRKFIIATTEILTSKRFLETLYGRPESCAVKLK